MGNETTPMKTCPHCKQEIPADATRCHYCCELAGKRNAFKAAVLSMLPVVLMLLVMMYVTGWGFWGGRKYWEHPNDITVKNHHAAKGVEGGLCVIGTVKNTSAIPWEDVLIQVDYYNTEDELVDTSQDYTADVLAPGKEQPFKVKFEEIIEDADYNHYRVSVAGAEDASRF